MDKLRPFVGVIVGWALLAMAGAARASVEFPDQIPNGAVDQCDTCHTSTNPVQFNAFGDAMLNLGNGPVAERWGALYAEDSDGDGAPNGLELGDPCGVWAPGAAPQRADDISNPGDPASKPAASAPDCGGGEPGATSSGAGATTGGAPPPPSTASGPARLRPDVPQNACSLGAAPSEGGRGAWALGAAFALALLGARRRR